MGYSKEQLLARLKDLQISFSIYEHPVVLTVDAQAKYVGHLQGELSKNLFLKDKKQRFYIVSASANTRVDLKVLSQRLGLGKGGLRMAPEEALQEVLQVPLGCVTPFALVNESASHVSLLLDQVFKDKESCFFHPLSNDMTISLHACDLEKFLISIGKEASFVDLEANPPVGKDQPPDLAGLVLSGSVSLPQNHVSDGSSNKPGEKPASVTKQALAIEGNVVKLTNKAQAKDTKAIAKPTSSIFTDAEQFTEEILNRTLAIIHEQITDESIKRHGARLGDVISDRARKHLSSDLKNIAIIFKNSAYAQGFKAASHSHPKNL
uniref:YbaK/aminoacyl-tRNA synthetase-associated domain-containing protein n=1 Tax=Kalanchoe fedtschenkoi TaxID=63787 RepID=A0A7N0VAN4_KALFE